MTPGHGKQTIVYLPATSHSWIVSCRDYATESPGAHAPCTGAHVIVGDDAIIKGALFTGDCYIYSRDHEQVCLYRCRVSEGAVCSSAPISLIESTATVFFPLQGKLFKSPCAPPCRRDFANVWRSKLLEGTAVQPFVSSWLDEHEFDGPEIVRIAFDTLFEIEETRYPGRFESVFDAVVDAGVHSDLFGYWEDGRMIEKYYSRHEVCHSDQCPQKGGLTGGSRTSRTFAAYTNALRAVVPVDSLADVIRGYLVGGFHVTDNACVPGHQVATRPNAAFVAEQSIVRGAMSLARCRKKRQAFIEGRIDAIVRSGIEEAICYGNVIAVPHTGPPNADPRRKEFGVCGHCRRNTRRRCPCQTVFYCGAGCQRRGWKAHKQKCLMRGGM